MRNGYLIGIALMSLVCASILLIGTPARAAPLTIVNRGGQPVEIYASSEALVIGLSEYRGSRWARLPSINNEIKTVRNLLVRQGFEIVVRENLDASLLKEAVRSFLEIRRPRSTRLVVFIAGHGWTDNFLLTGHVVPTDAPGPDSRNFRKMLLDMDTVKDWAKASNAQHILFLFDSCFAGAVFLHRSGYTPPQTLFLDDAMRRARQFMTAGDERQVVPAISKFVPALDQALTLGLADFNRDGLVTANELGMWVKERVIATGTTTPQYGELPEARSIPGTMIFVAGGIKQRNTPIDVAASAPPSTSTKERRAAAIGGAPRGREVFNGLDVLYYRKAVDGRTVLDALNEASIPFVETRKLLPDHFPVNAIACGPDTPLEALRTLALVLLDHGIPVRVVLQYGDPARLKGDLEIISLTKGGRGRETLDSPPLSREDISKMTACPRWLQRGAP